MSLVVAPSLPRPRRGSFIKHDSEIAIDYLPRLSMGAQAVYVALVAEINRRTFWATPDDHRVPAGCITLDFLQRATGASNLFVRDCRDELVERGLVGMRHTQLGCEYTIIEADTVVAHFDDSPHSFAADGRYLPRHRRAKAAKNARAKGLQETSRLLPNDTPEAVSGLPTGHFQLLPRNNRGVTTQQPGCYQETSHARARSESSLRKEEVEEEISVRLSDESGAYGSPTMETLPVAPSPSESESNFCEVFPVASRRGILWESLVAFGSSVALDQTGTPTAKTPPPPTPSPAPGAPEVTPMTLAIPEDSWDDDWLAPAVPAPTPITSRVAKRTETLVAVTGKRGGRAPIVKLATKRAERPATPPKATTATRPAKKGAAARSEAQDGPDAPPKVTPLMLLERYLQLFPVYTMDDFSGKGAHWGNLQTLVKFGVTPDELERFVIYIMQRSSSSFTFRQDPALVPELSSIVYKRQAARAYWRAQDGIFARKQAAEARESRMTPDERSDDDYISERYSRKVTSDVDQKARLAKIAERNKRLEEFM